MKAALKNGVESGTLVQVKASYKLSADAKKAATKKPKAPKAVKKAPKKKKVSTVRLVGCLLAWIVASTLAHTVVVPRKHPEIARTGDRQKGETTIPRMRDCAGLLVDAFRIGAGEFLLFAHS